MVLDNLGSALKDTLKKIAGALFVNERMIDELVRDIQRALLQADVQVQLVFELTNKIKKRALEEKASGGMTQREHVIKIVYDELVTFFGEEKHGVDIKKKKPFKIMMVGLYGSGKCVHPESNVVLSDGEVVIAEELYSRYSSREFALDDGFIVDVTNQPLTVPSFNPITLQIEPKKVTHLWKLQGKELLKVSLDNGGDFNVRVTPEHPFFVLRGDSVQQARADQLTEDDFVAVPRSYSLECQRQDLFAELKKLDLNVRGYTFDTSKNIRRDVLPQLNVSRNYCSLTIDLKQGIAPIELVDTLPLGPLVLRRKGATKFINFPTLLTPELAEFLGYVIGDGHLDYKYVEIVNEDPEIIQRVKDLSRQLFNLDVNLNMDPRTRRTYHLTLSSCTLVEIINKLFNIPVGKKGKHLRVPMYIFKSPLSVVRAFLRAYFDCDAHAAHMNRGIEIVSESRYLLSDVTSLLHRFGILSTFSKKFVNDVPYWRLSIRARYAELYAAKIGFSVSHKQERIDVYSLIGRLQGCGKQDLLALGSSLKELRQSRGFSIGEIQQFVNSYGLYEKTGIISREALAGVVATYCLKKEGNIATMLNNICADKASMLSNAFVNGFTSLLRNEGYISEQDGSVHVTEKAKSYLGSLGSQQETFEFFRYLIRSDVCWLRVRKVESAGEVPFVYDLTVEDNHSFIADNIFVHNTTTIGKLAHYYAKRGMKIATVGLDVHRPAAPEQLRQLSGKVHVDCYIDAKEKDPLKVYKKFEKNFGKYDILIVDTAGRDALSKDLIQEIENVNSLVKPDENLLVLSADIGQAAMTQAEQFHKSCGVTGVVVTKLDGTAKGGGSLSACAVTKAPIKFIGVGEKIDDLEQFNPTGFVGRLLGMGDLEALLEKAKEAIDEGTADDLRKKLVAGDFNLLDLYEQMSAMRKMGPLSKIMEMMPGMGHLKIPKEMLGVQEEKLKRWKIIMDSCTKNELEDPDLIDAGRITRLSKGSGIAASEIREMLKQYRQSKKLMKMMKGKDPSKMMQHLGKFRMK